MGRPPLPENIVRKNIALDADVWDEVSEERARLAPKIPSEADMIRVLVREALDARSAARKPVKTPRKAPKA
jgi:hypothetical protein